jgi:hypothetical protein
MTHRFLSCAAILALAAGCASVPTPPSVVVPEKLRAPAGETLLRTLDATGVQVYECRAGTAEGAAPGWVFVAPEATLQDAAGAPAGRHGAGPSWEARDGSRVEGVVKAKVDAPDAGAIPWLLLATHSTGRKGAFSKVTSIQRVATVGGVAPTGGCTAATVGQQARVPYRAQYVLYEPTF